MVFRSHARADTQMVDFVVALDTRSGEVLSFLHNNGVNSGQGYTAQWLEQLTADQQVPGSGGDIGSILLAWSAEHYYEPSHNYNHNANDDDSTKVS